MNDLSDIKGLGPKGINNLKKVNINTCNDLINFYPYKYNVIKKSDIRSLNQDDKIIIDGYVETIPIVYFINKKLNKMSFKLNTGERIINITIFNRSYLKSKLDLKNVITIIGKYDKEHNSIVATDIRFEKIGDETKIEPVYHGIHGISNKAINNFIIQVLDNNKTIIDNIPDYFKEKYNFKDKLTSIKIVHNPNDIDILNRSVTRLKYEELFVFMLKMNYLKQRKKTLNGITRDVSYTKVKEFIDNLPFKLTSDQELSIQQIYEDMVSTNIMNRLLQGDVGSGKTIVAICAMYINFLSGYQSAMMAPTEVLAMQHYNNLIKYFENYNIKVGLLTGKMKASEKRRIHEMIQNGEIDVIIGTHALITEDVIYKNLGLVITDEQHRFGVNQRGCLKSKGINPDILYMSATPIPRTYALTLYGDMDISNIKTMPIGRKDVQTYLKSNNDIKDVLMMMYSQLRENHQIYVVAPLIEESENSDMENVLDLYDKMNRAFGKKYSIGIMHGKLKNDEKEEMMRAFKENKIQVLVATTVIEVGVDVPNATMMVIFDAYRFGLSTIHQLRGRVGRNSFQSYCILISDKETKRLQILTETTDGFKISEEDFLLRGSGDIFGIKQSGDMVFNLSNLKRDYKLLLRVKDDVEYFVDNIIDNDNNVYFKELIKNSINLN